MLVELKNGETYNGQLVNCDTWMNIHLREVICTSKISFRVTCRASQAHSILACASTCLPADEPSQQETGLHDSFGSFEQVPVVSSQSTPQERKERRPWTPTDDMLLISSWLNTSKDPVVGNEQKSGAFWKRIAAYYAATPKAASREHHEASQCKQRWHKINDLVCKFCSAYESATREKGSGQNENDVLKLGHQIFFNDHKKKFTLRTRMEGASTSHRRSHAFLFIFFFLKQYLGRFGPTLGTVSPLFLLIQHVNLIPHLELSSTSMRNDQKWCELSTTKTDASSKRRRSEEGSESPGSRAEEMKSGEDDLSCNRPPGVKAAKAIGKRENAEGNTLTEFQRMWDIKQKDLEMKERLSKMGLIDSLIAKTVPLSEFEEALKKKLITELLATYDQSTEERHNQHMSDNGVSQGVVARSGNGFVEISSSDPESMDTGGNNNESTSEEKDMVSSCREPEKLSGSSMEEAWEDHGCVLWDLAASRNHAELMVHANLMVKQKRGH